MTLPSPDNLGSAPAWENYIIAQTTQASLGLIPRHALALGVEVNGASVRLVFQLSELTEGDKADIDDIVNELEALVGDDVEVGLAHEILDRRRISPSDRARWIFLSHTVD